MSKKRRREADTVDTRLVEIYEDLANEDNAVQLKAAQALLSHLSSAQQPTKDQIGNAVRRLFRGLCSGRKAARLGFSIALTELLAYVVGDEGGENSPKLHLEKVFEILESTTSPSGNISGQVNLLIFGISDG
jgi:DNA polymerase phi